jgi:NRAMP (natural resistance-associated macrophage protein)-like metal ion transporter
LPILNGKIKIVKTKTTKKSIGFLKKIKRFAGILGPGLITGASDDDPSGIATYTQAGAAFGFTTLWTALFTYPLMASIQGMCARIGIVTKEGLARTLKQHYPKSILYLMMVFSFPAIVLNIGADIQGMGAVSNLLFPKIPVFAFCLFFSAILIFVIIKYPYQKFAAILKWLCISLLLYILIPFLIHADWMAVFKNTFIPHIQINKAFVSILVAIFGTTISPYLFFWQTTMEAEDMAVKKILVNKRVLKDMKEDVNTGMLFSNLVMFFIILTAGVVLHGAGITKIDTVDQAAKALEPVAGKMAYLFFAVGVVGTGFLAIPVLAGSLSYQLAETFGWQEGLDKKFFQARGFYLVIIVAICVGLALNFAGVSPVQSLIYTSILYGLTAPVMIAIVLHISNNKKIMGSYINKPHSNIFGFITLALMTVAAVALLWFQFN